MNLISNEIQSNVAPADAVKMWTQLEEVANAHGLKLSSPATSACGPNPATDCYGVQQTHLVNRICMPR